ncbi:endonuclease MutS2 [Crassaminicella thermophila]|uniref:Endonuclease MutS2 n=1 Tax=Crassaminicella thermophila TaxID=2599308 RepID=A0A5C0SD78_CRATE|nr:endonuclease MutS2 [Crassaminicella thermophila]QEK12483.1 endonuclease MutS2 [Crassaminicella thermophila]
MNERTLRVLEFQKIKDKLIEQVETSLGKEIAEKIEPSIEYEKIVSWQQETHEATSMIIQRGNIPLGGIHDLSYHLKRAEIGTFLYPGQLLEVSDTLRAARRLKNFIKEKKEESRFPIVEGYVSSLFTFKRIEDRINECIVGEDEISDNASPTLKNIRRSIESKNVAIRNRLNSIISSSKNQKFLQDAIITIRQDRYVVPVKQEYRSNIPGLVHDQSSSGATLFIEPMAIVELNNELKELKLKEKAEIERILMELTTLIGEKVQEIKSNQKILAMLDFIFAKGKLAVKMRAVEPKMNKNGYIRIKNGRHPLLDPKTVIPTNIWIGDEFKTLVITGPNTGGKTVTLKTVGLLTLMAQCGLHVPADYGTELAVFEQVFADIGDEQSIEQSLSTFSSHMTNIVEILDTIKVNALVLLDELGAGTDPTEGAALAIAILDHLYKLGVRTIATTHYTELKQFALTTKGVENASVEFNVETLSPTYKLLIGVPGKSNAFEISKRLGLNQYIIDKSKNLISREDIAFEDILTKIEKDRRIAEEERDEAVRLKLIVQKQKDEYERMKEKLALQREKLMKEAREEARKILKNAKEEADRIIKELRDLAREQEEKERNRKIEEARRKLRGKLNNMEDGLGIPMDLAVNTKPPKNLKIGDTVLLLNLNQKGSVITKPDANGDLTVQVGIMKVNVNIKNLRLDKEEKEKIQKTGTGKILKRKAETIKNSIDLRGQTLEEAFMNTDKYLDDAYIAGLNEVTVIHGKGTGVLREGIKKLLKKHKHVKSFRDGTYGEGGTGVTIVELK